MSALNYPIVGVPKKSPAPADHSVPLRLEIRDMQVNYPDQWNLYLLGLLSFQQREETSDLSYYGIAGIHGRPYQSWGGSKASNPGGWQGYCTHSSILFAPWHRPYLALYEQNLYEEVNNIANNFPENTRARYQEAASTFRAPYWDWAAPPPAGDSYFPNSVGSETADVIRPDSDGEVVQIPNPLYSFQFNPLNPNGNDFASLRGTPYNRWPVTLRYPTSTTSVNATSQSDEVVAAMESQFPGLQSDVNILLSDPSYKGDFAAFSNNAWQRARPNQMASIEDLHGSIHVAVGGAMGHMSQLQYSAFDPVFWLHHTNVDRIFAIWQALNPQAYQINKREEDGTFSIAGGSQVNAQTPLYPFMDSTGRTPWTSVGAQRTQNFNYAYPETQRWRYSTTQQYVESVEEAVARLYGETAEEFRTFATDSAEKSAKEPAAPVPAADQKPIHAPTAESANNNHKSGFHPFHDIKEKFKDAISGDAHAKNGTRGGIDLESEIGKDVESIYRPQATSYTEYIVTLKGPKHVLQQTYVVYVFVGEFDGATNTWCTQDALAGTFTVFGKALTTGCEKCAKDAEAELQVSGTVNLTATLLKELKRRHLGSMEKENVIPWLKKNLHWRVGLADGSEKDRVEVPGLKVGVVSTRVDLPVGGRPIFSGVYEIHTEVTEGRPAGLNNVHIEPALPDIPLTHNHDE